MIEFDRESFEYLALRASIADLLDRGREAERFLDELRLNYPQDPRVEDLVGRLAWKGRTLAPEPPTAP